MKKFLALSLSLILVVASISAFGVMVAANPNDINDDLVDFSKIYQTSGEGTLALENLDLLYLPAGDATALKKVDNDAERYVIYQVSGRVNVTVEYVNYGGDINYAKNKMSVYQSSDNITYEQVVCTSNWIASNGAWHRMNVVSNATAINTQYIKVVYDNSYPESWTPMMTSVMIADAPAPQPFTGTDDLTDFSKIYQMSGTATLALQNLDLVNLPAGDATALKKVDNNAERYVIYKVSGRVNVTVEYVNYGGDINYAKNKMRVYQSSDNVTYTEVVCASNWIASNGVWHRMNVVSNATAINTQYIKVVYDNSYPANWTPMMTSVMIADAPVPQPFTGTDDLTDFSKIYQMSGADTLALENLDLVNLPAGDATAMKKVNNDAERYVIYKVSGSVNVTVEYVNYGGDTNYAKNKMYVYQSNDNVTYAEVVCASNWIASKGAWHRMNVVSGATASNTQYIKVVYDNSYPTNWTPMMTSVKIEATTIPPFVNINDDLTDLSKTFATSGSSTLSAWTGNLVDHPAGDLTGYIKANHNADRFITYKVSGCVQVTAEYLINSGDEIFALNKMKLYYSVDNLTYKAITCKSNLINQHTNGWKRMNIVSNPLPADAEYVKLVYDRSAQVWDSILVDVDIVSSTLLPIAFYSYDMSVSNIISKVSESTTSTAFAADAYKAEGVTLTIKKNGITLGASDLVGTGVVAEVFTGTTTVNYTVLIKGDVDGNGTIALADLAAMKLHLLQSTQLTGIYKTAGLFNNRTNITIIDLMWVKKHLLGIYLITQA